jgi:cell division septation protein DedD
MAEIRVPKTPRKAYNPQRPPGTLLQNQLCHLEWAVRPAAARTRERFRIKPAKTEAEAADRIAKLTAQLHEQAAAPRDVVPPTPGLPAAASAAPAAKPTKKRKSASKPKSKPKPQSRPQRSTRRRSSR